MYVVILDEEPNCGVVAHAENMRRTGTLPDHMNREILGIFYKQDSAIEYAIEYAKDNYRHDVLEGLDSDDDYDSFMDEYWFDGEGYLKEAYDNSNDIRLHIMVKDVEPKYCFPSTVYLVLLNEEPNPNGTVLKASDRMIQEVVRSFYKKEDAVEFAAKYAKENFGYDAEEELGDDDSHNAWLTNGEFWFDGGYLKKAEDGISHNIRLEILDRSVE